MRRTDDRRAVRVRIAGVASPIFLLPILAGLAGTVLPAFGYLPALGGTTVSLSSFERLASEPAIAMSAWLSLKTGLLSAAIALFVVMAFFAGCAGTRLMVRVQHLVSPVLAIPHAAAAFALTFLIAPSGLFLRLLSPELTGFTRPPDWLVVNDPQGLAMIAGLAIKEIPFLFLMTLAALPQVPLRASAQLSAGLGYGRMAGFLLTTWPPVYRQIRLAVFAVIAYATSVADVAIILGPGLPPTLAVRVTEWMADPDLNLRFVASAGAMLQLAVTLLAMAIWLGVERAGAMLHRLAVTHGWRFRRDGVARSLAMLLTAIPAGAIFLGIGVLGIWSVSGLWPFPDDLPTTLTLKTWMRHSAALGTILSTTLVLAAASSAIALVAAIAIFHHRTRPGSVAGGAGAALYLPLLMPQITFVFGLHVLTLAIGLGPSLPLLIAVHLIFVLPYVMLSLSDPWRALDPRYERIAAGLGASPARILLAIRLPMLFRPLLTALAVGFAVSVGLYLPTLLIGAGRFATVTTEAVVLSSGGDRRVVAIYALVQALLPFIGFAIASVLPHLLFRHRRAMRI